MTATITRLAVTPALRCATDDMEYPITGSKAKDFPCHPEVARRPRTIKQAIADLRAKGETKWADDLERWHADRTGGDDAA